MEMNGQDGKPIRKMNVPYDEIEPGILEIVKLLNENGMMPFASCDGTVKAHINPTTNRYDHQLGYVIMMDSDFGRDLLAILQDNPCFQLRIQNNPARMYYDNLIEGISYAIDFDNYNGEKSLILEEVLKELLSGKRPTAAKRAQIDRAIDSVQKVSEIAGVNLELSFNDVAVKDLSEPNFRVAITDEGKKDLASIFLENGIWEEDFSAQIDSRGASYIVYSNDYGRILDVLDSIHLRYDEVGRISPNSPVFSYERPKNRKVNMASAQEVEEYIESLQKTMMQAEQIDDFSMLMEFFSSGESDEKNFDVGEFE